MDLIHNYWCVCNKCRDYNLGIVSEDYWFFVSKLAGSMGKNRLLKNRGWETKKNSPWTPKYLENGYHLGLLYKRDYRQPGYEEYVATLKGKIQMLSLVKPVDNSNEPKFYV